MSIFNFFRKKKKGSEYKFLDKKSEREIIKFTNGKINCETEIQNDKREGYSVGYFENGIMQFQGFYKNDKKQKLWKFYYENGNIQSETTYLDGYLHGRYTNYYENGFVQEDGTYLNGFLEGVNNIYYENGLIKTEENRTDGRLNGLITEFDINGNVISKNRYKHNNLIELIDIGLTNSKQKNLLDDLKKINPNIKIYQNKIESDVNIYKEFLATNLDFNINQICQISDDGRTLSIQGVYFPFRDYDISFSIEILNQKYKGAYTIWCPELRGCITQGETKKEAFDNLLYAISEILIINQDFLNHKPITHPITPIPTHTHIKFPNTNLGHTINGKFIRSLIDLHNFKNFYIGNKHIILKKEKIDNLNIVIPFNGINDLTKFCIDNILLND